MKIKDLIQYWRYVSFSFRGRINRTCWWLHLFLTYPFLFLAGAYFYYEEDTTDTIFSVIVLLYQQEICSDQNVISSSSIPLFLISDTEKFSEKPNVMDTEPFFEFNMSDIQSSLVNVLKNFTKDKFDLNNARSIAVDLKYRGEIKQIRIEQLETPTNGFVRFFYEAIKSQMEIQGFTDVVKRAFHEFLDEYSEKEPNKSDERSEEEPNEGNRGRLKLTNLRVTMPDESVIHHYNGKETYIEVLEKLGLEEVMRVRPNIVSTEQFTLATKGIKQGKFWIRGTNGYSTRDRKVELEKIADLLGVPLRVERVEKKPKSS